MSKQQTNTTEDHKTIQQQQEALPTQTEAAEFLSSGPSTATVQRVLDNPGSLNPNDVAALQRSHGNQFVQRLLGHDLSATSAPATLQRRTAGVVQRWSLGSMWESTKNAASGAWEGTKNAASDAWDGAKNLANKGWESTKNAASDAWQGAKNIASDAWDGAKNLANKGWTGTKKAANAVGRGAKKAVKAVGDVASAAADLVYHSDYVDLNAKQYRVSRSGGDVLVEEVVAQRNEEGGLVYSAIGKVIGYESKRPIMEMYPEPVALNGWVPRVTHLNGMMVDPEGGIGSARALHTALNTALAEQAALDAAGIDVLYTYSASRGFGTDLGECIMGKLYVDDAVTDRQEAIMMSAIRTKQRTTVSAHSRGTIKTDNAVRNVYNTLHKEYMALYRNDPEIAEQARREAASMVDPTMGIDEEMATAIAARAIASRKASDDAKREMDMYIQLVYAGNAVQFPSSALKGDLFVGNMDFVSMTVGKYAKWATPEHMTMHKVPGGHEFDTNYAGHVGKHVANDIKKDGQR